jgi:23S rRNA (uracil1939-C5)-methyltransferase
MAARLGEAAEGALVLVDLVDDRGQTLERWGAPALDLAAPGEAPFWGAPHRFSQANPEVNQALRALVRAWAAEALGDLSEAGSPDRGMLELFAGSGNFTRELATLGPVVAVEGDPGAVALGRRNLAGSDVTWLEEDAALALSRLGKSGATPALVVLDPPRSGARDLLGPLSALAPPRILYVSCDAMTLARDVAALVSEGYLPVRMEALDTLPQTAHFEIVMDLRLQRRRAR